MTFGVKNMHLRVLLLGGAVSLLIVWSPENDVFDPSSLQPIGACATGLSTGDTARFTGVMSRLGVVSFPSDAPKPPGSLKLWKGQDERFHFSQSWIVDTVVNGWDGDVGFGPDGLPHSFLVRSTRNGVVVDSELAEQVGESVTVTRNGRSTVERVDKGVLRFRTAGASPLRVLLLQCTVSRPAHELLTQWALMRARRVSTITLTAEDRKQTAALYVVQSDSGQEVVAWLQPQNGRLVAMRGANGDMDLIAEGWESSLDQIMQAEVKAARPAKFPEGCANGTGPGACEPHTLLISEACRDIPRRLKPRPTGGGIVTLSDSGYSVTSDGLGPYRAGVANVRVSPVDVGAAFVLGGLARGPMRSFSVDLNHPVDGDMGVPLGVIKADGAWHGPFMPAGTNYSIEISFGGGGNSDTTQFTGDIPVGATVRGGIGLDLYVDGVAHVLQAGPGAWGGFCSADGSATYGDGTSMGTISHPTATSWVVDLPPGSVGRLFDIRREVKGAVNKGLYYMSLHLTIQK